MKELENLRSYNRKVFKNEDNSLQYVFRSQHCHYKNIETGKFEEIDTTMYFDESTRTFRQFKASYHSDIPEYADEVIGFRNLYDGKDHKVSAKPICNHVKGQLFNNTKDGNYVEYKDAFSSGIDLRIFAYAHGLKEVVVINSIHDTDLTFDFEIIVDDSIEFKNKENIVWDKQEGLIFKNKTIKLNHSNDRGSFFRVAQVWDSNFKIQPVDIELYRKDYKLFLRKTVTYEFMKDSVFPVYTDHATSYFMGNGDGFVDAKKFVNFISAWGQSNWDYIHDTDHSVEDFESSEADYTGIYLEVGPYVAAGDIRLERMFLPIDTSGIDDSATISAASLFLKCIQKYDGQNDSYGYIAVVNTTQASTSSLVVTDYDNCGDSINNPTEGTSTANRVDVTNVVSDGSAFTEFILNSTGIGWINKTGYSKFGMRQGLDVQDIVPNNDMNGIRIICCSSETTGTSDDPYISVTVSASDITFNGSTQYAKGIVIN